MNAEFDVALSEYERYGESWSEHRLHKFIKKWVAETVDEVVELQDDLECVRSRCDDLEADNHALEQRVDEITEALEESEDEVERLRNLIVDLRRGH